MKGHAYLTQLASHGEYFFTTTQLATTLGVSLVAARAIVRRLRKKNEIATPYREFHLIIPPEYQTIGCLPPEQFIADLMNYLKTPYYVGLLSAGQFYGAAHQKPQIFQVMVPDNRRSILCGKIHIEFIARKVLQQLPTRQFKTVNGYLNVATPEVLALDLTNYALQSGGLNNVVTVLEELKDSIDKVALSRLTPLIKITPQLQRLGFMFEIIGEQRLANVIYSELTKRNFTTVLLVPKARGTKKGTMQINQRWKITINEEWESDL
jgi:predicted transcriptional regulator of viral defense system